MARMRWQGDRLSALPDATLARILSHLTTDEAARTSVLARRWRRVHATVPVLHLVDRKKGDRDRRHDHQPVCFDHQVTGALLCRDATAPIRALRLDVFHPTTSLFDQWIVIALDAGAEDIDIKLRYWDSSTRRLCPFGPSTRSSADFDYQSTREYIKTPRRFFRSCNLRRLCLTNWTLDLPRDVSSLVSLETLVLKRIMTPDGALQRQVSNCPRLADLTLEECPSAKEITVTSACLRSFTMACCHYATRVVLDTPCLRLLHYKGGVLPDMSFFSLRNRATVRSLTIDICEDLAAKKSAEINSITKFIDRCTNLTFLHLSLRPEMAYYSGLFTRALRGLPRLRQLELKGCVHNDDSVHGVAVLLQNTSKLESLSLISLHPDPPNPYDLSDLDVEIMQEDLLDYEDSGDELQGQGNDMDDNFGGHVHVPNRLWRIDITCFKLRLRRISLEGYGGWSFERVLAKFLLAKAEALEEFSVSIEPGRSKHKLEIARELTSWRFNDRTRINYA